VKSTSQVLPTSRQAHWEAIYRDTQYINREVYLVNQDSAEAAYPERNLEVDRIVTEADFERRVNAKYR